MSTLNAEYKVMWHIALTWHPLSELLDWISSSESTWQIETKCDMIWMFIEWFPTKTCVVVSKEGVSILYMDFNYVSKGRHIVLFWFFLPLLLLLSEACPDHNLFFFPDRSIIFGMWVHDHVAYRNHLRGTQYLGWPLQPSSELCTWFVSHNWMTLFQVVGESPPPKKKEGHLGVWQLWMKNIKIVWHIALTWHPLSVNF